MHAHIDSSTHYPAFKTIGLHSLTPTLTHCVPCREAVCTIFMMVFGMTRPGGELTTYREADTLTTKPIRQGTNCQIEIQWITQRQVGMFIYCDRMGHYGMCGMAFQCCSTMKSQSTNDTCITNN